jgi:hypothetical protein
VIVRGCCYNLNSHLRRTASATSWIFPGAALLFFPKCPACVAAYLAVATGLSISASAVARLRVAALILIAIPMTLALASFFSSKTGRSYIARLRWQKKVATAAVLSWFRSAIRLDARIGSLRAADPE